MATLLNIFCYLFFQIIRHLSDHLLSCEENLRETQEKLSSINVLSSVELSPFLPPNVADKLSSSDRRILASTKMNEEVTRFEHDIRLSGTPGFDLTVIELFCLVIKLGRITLPRLAIRQKLGKYSCMNL